MGTFTQPYQNLSFAIPDINEVFRGTGDDTNQALYFRSPTGIQQIDVGQIGKKEYEKRAAEIGVDLNKTYAWNSPEVKKMQEAGIPMNYNASQALYNYNGGGWDAVRLGNELISKAGIVAPNRYNIGDLRTPFGDVSAFTGELSSLSGVKPTTTGEVITRSISASNPNGADMTSSLTGTISKSPSLAEVLRNAGATPQQIAEAEAKSPTAEQMTQAIQQASQGGNAQQILQSLSSPLAQQPINNTNPTSTTMNNQLPSTNLQPGSTGEDVKKLQDYLVSQGLMTQAQVNTGYGTYGPQTTAAVKALQEKLGVDNSSGVGYFGPKTMAAIASTGAGSATSSTGAGASNELQTILSNPGLSDDQKSLIQNLYDTVSTNDTANAEKIMAAFKAATEFSDPYFKAQTLIATDALSRALGATDGDLAFQEKKLRDTLSDLTATVSASKGQLDFNKQQELKKLSDSYTADLEATQQNLAATGKTSSSVRTKAEGLLAEQNQGLVESTNRQFSYQTGTLDRSLANSERDTAQSLTYLQDKATQDRIANLRKTEEQVGSTALSNLGYTGLLGNVGGSIPRQKTLDALSFSNSFVF